MFLYYALHFYCHLCYRYHHAFIWPNYTHTHTQTYAHRVTHLFFLLFFSFNETRKTRTHKHTHTDARRSAASANKCKKKILSIHIHGIMLCFIQTIRVPHTDGKRRPEWIRSSRVNSQIFDGEEESNKQTNRKHLGSDN